MHDEATTLTIALHVRPGRSHPAVGGRHGTALVVSVSARAVDGAATEATLRAVADAFDLKRRQVSLRSGATSRSKVVQLTVEADDVPRVERRFRALLEEG